MGNALEYDAIASGVFAPLYPVVAEAILERIGVVSGRMLDVGCGGGHLGFAVMERAPFEGWLVDVSPDAVELCRERSLGRGLGDRCRCLVGDVHALPLEDAFFDLVVSRGSMGFWRDYPLAFGEIRRVLKPGGRAYVGGGLGNRETFERIRARMRELEPDWPANIKKRQRSVCPPSSSAASSSASGSGAASWKTRTRVDGSSCRGRGPDMGPRPRLLPRGLKWSLMAAAPVVLFFLSFAIGRYPIGAGELAAAVWRRILDLSPIADGRMATVLFNIRLPRVLAVMLVGAGLSVAGAAYQGLFKNPIVSPDILGASAGAGFGAALGLLLGLGLGAIQALALVGGIAAVLFTVLVNRTLSRDPLLGLVLGGIMVSTLCSAFTSCTKLVADSDGRLPAITFWLMGGFHAMTRSKLLAILAPISLSLGVLYAMGWRLNVLSFGEDEARSLGVEPRRVRFAVILAATLITASSVSVAGMVGWVGLVIPHLGRALVGADFRALLPASALLGASYLLVVDDVVRNAASVEIPIGILGVPFFLAVYRASSRR